MPQTLALQSTDSWQSQLRDVITSADQLLGMLALRPQEVGFSAAASRQFALKVPTAFVRRMQVGDPRDPLLMQVLANQRELLEKDGFERDPVGELGAANPHKGILHKYHGRVLLIVSSGCAVHCRYCFRRHFPYPDNQNGREEWREALRYIASDTSIREVILSGGDPMLASDTYLHELVNQIETIPHVRRLRIHSRLPVVIPARITADMIAAIRRPGIQTIMVIHCNHANEIDLQVESSLEMMAREGITLLNQAVLLAGVNDSADALCELSERLFAAGVMPYYLHLLDKVQGAAHFDVDEQRALHLLDAITARLPGYMVPKLVRETAGAESKISADKLRSNGGEPSPVLPDLPAAERLANGTTRTPC